MMLHETSNRNNTRRRHRSLRGCTTCRRRHVKCDEGFPSCSTCQRQRLDCGGYKNAVFFSNSGNDDAEYNGGFSSSGADDFGPRCRRPLFTEVQREIMCQALLDSAPIERLTSLLEEIDQSSNQMASSNGENVHVSYGPFGVFRGYQSKSILSADSQTVTAMPLSQVTRVAGAELFFGDVLPNHNDDAAIPDVTNTTDSTNNTIVASTSQILLDQDEALLPWSQEMMQAFFSLDEVYDTSPSSLDSSINVLVDSDPITQEILNDDISTSHLLVSVNSTVQSSSLISLADSWTIHHSTLNPKQFQILLNNGPLGSLQHAVVLTKHYKATVLNLLTPIKHTKTPWHILFIPQIKNCLAAFTLNETVDHASLATFYGALAVSALSLGNVSSSQDWLQQAQIYRQHAEENIKLTLQSVYNIPKTAKYKNCLMALLTMVHLSIFAGHRDQAGQYLLETEKLIRLRGLNRQKSKKIRLLHHCYVFERLFHETLSAAHQISQDRLKLCEAVETSGLGAHSVDGILFRLPDWVDLDEEMSRPKDRQTGENDLLLAHLGEFSSTLYPEIFGIPEPWMQILSLMIRLGHEKSAIERNDSSTPLDFRAFMVRAKAIEKHIIRLNPEADVLSMKEFGIDRVSDTTGLLMLKAVQQAMLIYFYRRVYDLDSSMLQGSVAAVRESLTYCCNTEPERIYGFTGFIWPSFIAACEADDLDSRQFFTTWFSRAVQQSGGVGFSDMLRSMEQIWKEKDQVRGVV